MRRNWGCLLLLAALAIVAFLGWRHYEHLVDTQPELFPWTPLSLEDPVGPFTGDKLAALTDDPQRCQSLIGAATLETQASDNANCGFADGIRIDARPSAVVTACPVAAAVQLWRRETLEPAAQHHFGTSLAEIVHSGSYSCRRLYGRDDGPWSRHATADALDVAGFVLEDGRTLSLLADWDGDPAAAAFLRDARDGACELFASVLSPDYNEAHADHFHLAMPSGTGPGWSACR